MYFRNRHSKFPVILKVPIVVLLWFIGWGLCYFGQERKPLLPKNPTIFRNNPNLFYIKENKSEVIY